MISYAELTFGPYVDAAGAPACAGLRGTITPSSPRIRSTDLGGEVIVRATAVVIGADGTATVYLPHTDQDGLDPVDFTYSVRWARGFGATPGDLTFALPVDGGDVVDYDLLSDSPAAPGTAVPVLRGPKGEDGEPGPTGPPGNGSALVLRQTTPAASWSFTHNLGRPASVTVYVDGERIFPEVRSTDTDILILWASATAGVAVIS